MENNKKTSKDLALELVLRELKENPYRKFHTAFSLMSVIPFLVFFYILSGELFSFDILIGNIGLVLCVAIIISLSGFVISYGIMRNILNKVIFYAAQAKHSDQMKSTFVASVSHELKNPLASMKLSLSNMLDGLAGHLNEEQKKIVNLCGSIIDRMARLINDLLDLHKIEAGMFEVRRKLCDLGRILDNQIAELDAVLSQKRIKLHKEISSEELFLWGDEEKLAQVVNNLISNAIKYTPEDGSVFLRAMPDNGFMKMECADTGSGIPPDGLNRIFNKFERFDKSKEGTGLGLAIAKDIVEMHKGKILVESEVGKGSKFTVVLPRDLRRSAR